VRRGRLVRERAAAGKGVGGVVLFYDVPSGIRASIGIVSLHYFSGVLERLPIAHWSEAAQRIGFVASEAYRTELFHFLGGGKG
jgi:hypothetical protein